MNPSQENGTSVKHEKFLFDCDHLITFCTNFGKSDMEDQTDSVLETKLEDLENRWKKLQTSYESLMISPRSENSQDFKENAKVNFNACSETYYACRSHIVDLLRLSRACEVQTSMPRTSLLPQALPLATRSSFIKLPPCDIDTFTGSYEEWPAFRDLFTTACIENIEIPKAQKLFYLRLKTKGSAGAIVKRYTLCDENFDHAWNALKARFDNKRVLIDNKLKVLFNIPVATSENSESIQKIHSTVTDCLTSLKALNVKVEGWDPILIYLVSTKLPDDTLALWEQSFKTQREMPTWAQMDEFLVNRYEVVERISSIKTTKQRFSLPTISNPKIQSYSSQEKLEYTCKLCNGDHNLRVCGKFRKYTVQQRIDYVFQNKICNNCLSSGHTKSKCISQNTCFICKSNHHTLLHLQKPQNSSKTPRSNENIKESKILLQKRNDSSKNQDAEQSDNVPSSSPNCQVQANFSSNNVNILLRTALVQIEHFGELFTVRALIDPGSQRTFLTERIRSLLKLPYQKAELEVVGIGGQVQSANKECEITLFAKRYLADPNFNHSSQIDLIIGNDSEHFINIGGIKKNICGQASAYNTIFGWVLSGPIEAKTIHTFTTTVAPSENAELNNTLRKFWEQEEIPSRPIISEDDQYCETFYKKTTTRDASGRYVVRLPLKKEFPNSKFLGASRILALVQYSRINQSLAKTPELAKEYNNVLEEYLSLNHMEPVSYREIVSDGKYFSFYLPHHAVVRPRTQNNQEIINLKTVTFGVNCAPFLAIRTLHQLAEDSQEMFPKAAEILRTETYVDDILSGGHTIKEAIESQSQILETLKSAGFILKKITANDTQLLINISSEDLYDSNLLRFHETSATKTL
ncbi:uncharacterized protein LOC119607034, partial [Lucilia sericata]|uniref:uncharacterized protein LOC119607034 n=1 Tax=Lucilia sericata TaxID=13632 RepID=UPI0018A84BCC